MTAYKIVVAGASLGGLHALQVVLAALPAGFSMPMVVVQHRDKAADDTLATLLQRHCRLPVEVAYDKAAIGAGRVYVAPPNYHLLIEERAFALSTEAPVRFARPSIDVLFMSAADAYGRAVIGVILTGTLQDGAQGLASIAARGGLALVQDPATAEAPDMPQAAIAATPSAKKLPLTTIGSFLGDTAHSSTRSI